MERPQRARGADASTGLETGIVEIVVTGTGTVTDGEIGAETGVETGTATGAGIVETVTVTGAEIEIVTEGGTEKRIGRLKETVTGAGIGTVIVTGKMIRVNEAVTVTVIGAQTETVIVTGTAPLGIIRKKVAIKRRRKRGIV